MCGKIIMPKIIKLRGIAQVGKTTTLLLLADRLKSLGANESPRLPIFNSKKDVAIRTEYCNRIIGINTAGDTLDSIKDGYQKLGSDCDIYIFACRTSGKGNEWIDTTFSGCEIITVEKWFIYSNVSNSVIPSLQIAANEEQVRSLITMITAL